MKALSTPLSYEQPPLECAARRGGERDASPATNCHPRDNAAHAPQRRRAAAVRLDPPPCVIAFHVRARSRGLPPRLGAAVAVSTQPHTWRAAKSTSQDSENPPPRSAPRPPCGLTYGPRGLNCAHEGSIVPRVPGDTLARRARGLTHRPQRHECAALPKRRRRLSSAHVASRPPATHPVDVAAVDAYLLR